MVRQAPSAARRGGRFRLALACAAALALGGPIRAAASGKTDVVVLVNGDQITGQIKGVSRGKLDYKTDDAGRLSIDWVKVVRVTSIHTFEIETSSITRHYSALLPLSGDVTGVLLLANGETLPIPEVVSVVPIDAGIASRLQAYLDLGFTFAKANTTTTLSSDGMVGYRGERMGTSLQFDGYFFDSASSSASAKTSTQLTGDLYFNRWTAQLTVGTDRNDELDLKLRLGLGAGASYAAIRSNSMELTARAGLSALREQYTTGDAAYYLTAYLAGAWDAFRYDSPKLDAGISLAAYPYLNDLGRVRIETTLRLKYEVFKDFNVGLNLTDTYDSRPPEAGTKNDYVATFTIGWSYRR